MIHRVILSYLEKLARHPEIEEEQYPWKFGPKDYRLLQDLYQNSGFLLRPGEESPGVLKKVPRRCKDPDVNSINDFFRGMKKIIDSIQYTKDEMLYLVENNSPRCLLYYPDSRKIKKITNLGYLLKHWSETKDIEVISIQGDKAILVANFKSGIVYACKWESKDTLLDWLNRPVFRGLPIKVDGKSTGIIGK